MNARTLSLVTVALLALLAGCTTSSSGSVYERGQAQREMSVRTGVVDSVRRVTIAGNKSILGAGAGAIVGGAAGSKVGQGRGSDVGAVLGAVAGGIAGSAIEQATTKSDGVEITVRLDNGSGLVAITQEADEEFRPGDRVRLISSGSTTRVAH
ncbi:MAG: glycine zipper 2TM domain-containing protein [Rhodocyclaceae bacterium]|nr:glycine zipper 2TM domain-containing protein [Rhodocyclaceae bacterium]